MELETQGCAAPVCMFAVTVRRVAGRHEDDSQVETTQKLVWRDALNAGLKRVLLFVKVVVPSL